MTRAEPFAYPSTGSRDRLPAAAAELRLVEGQVSGALEAAGYQEVIPPLVDVLEVFELAGEEIPKLLDRSGRVLGLRADFTGPVARIAGMQLRERAGPLRLRYGGRVLRVRVRLRERMQAGAELFGVPAPAGDAEIIGAALGALGAAGVHARVAIGSVTVVSALLPTTAAVRRALERRDRKSLLALDEVSALGGERRRAVGALLDLIGGPEILDDARRLLPGCGRALDALAELTEALDGHDVELDLAHVRAPGYYTGTLFDLYADGAPRALGGGGRYDRLAARYGPDRPAVGVSIDLDGLAALVARRAAGTKGGDPC